MLTSIVSTLPAKWQPYAKAYAAAIVSALTAIAALTPLPEWLTIVVAVLSAPLVFATPNLDPAARAQDESVQPPDAERTIPPGGYLGRMDAKHDAAHHKGDI